MVSLGQALAHCPIVLTADFLKKSGPCLSSSVAGHPLGPAKNRRLGEQLPHQQPNSTKAYF